MSGQNDPFSSPQPGSWDDKGQPMVVYPQTPASTEAAAAVAVSRRSAALMWMGAFLGATVITAVFLGIVYMEASQDVRDLRTQLTTVSGKVTEAESKARVLQAREKFFTDENAKLATENDTLRARLRMPARPRPAPPDTDPFGN
jgi:cell division protein FtsB